MGISIERHVVLRFTVAVVFSSMAISGAAMGASKLAPGAQTSSIPTEDRYAQYPAPPGYPPPPPPPGYYPPAPPPCPAVTPSPLRGAARGAAGGAVFGAIAGDAGKGAAIGAAVGGVGAATRRGSARSAGACY
jgi:hypothetical protein